jgi:hypothetical protein
MTDETTPGDETTPEEEQIPQAPEPAEEKPSLKEGLREGAAKAFGLAVEVGSMLSGESGELVDAERDMASAEAEELIDRIDGEG